MIVHFVIIEHLFVVIVPVVICLLFVDYLPTAFPDMSWFFGVIKSCYVHNFLMPSVFSLVPVFPASCSVTLVLGFLVEGFSIFS